MKITQHTNKKYSYYTTERDKWYEWFRLEIEEGSAWRFYFPIERVWNRRTVICWVWYLVPFVLFIRLFQVAIKSIYLDTRQLLDDWKKYQDNKIKHI